VTDSQCFFYQFCNIAKMAIILPEKKKENRKRRANLVIYQIWIKKKKKRCFYIVGLLEFIIKIFPFGKKNLWLIDMQILLLFIYFFPPPPFSPFFFLEKSEKKLRHADLNFFFPSSPPFPPFFFGKKWKKMKTCRSYFSIQEYHIVS
jgi:hypothetical protein